MKFECQSSCGGKCCTLDWKDGSSFVFLTLRDIDRISSLLNLPVDRFADLGEFNSTRFTDKKSTQWFLKRNGRKCTFFVEGQCSIYENRPTQCRTYPYWPENLNGYNWKDEIKKACPGVGRGYRIGSSVLLAEQISADEELRSKASQ